MMSSSKEQNKTKSVKENPREANSHSADQNILCILQNQKVYYRIHKR
jgi:hypothetical protein